MLKIPRSTYYYRPENRVKMKTDNDLRDRIEEVALEFPKYGYRRITHQLKIDGSCVNHKRVLRIMRESSLLVAVKKRWVTTTDSNHAYPIYPNLTKERPPTATNQVWVSDITYIRIESGFVYLAVILDAFSRRVIRLLRLQKSGHSVGAYRPGYGYLPEKPRPGDNPPFRSRGAVCVR